MKLVFPIILLKSSNNRKFLKWIPIILILSLDMHYLNSPQKERPGRSTGGESSVRTRGVILSLTPPTPKIKIKLLIFNK